VHCLGGGSESGLAGCGVRSSAGTGGCLILKIFKKASSFDFQILQKKNWNQKFLDFPNFAKNLERDALQFPKF
jgi:hypothetical protein